MSERKLLKSKATIPALIAGIAGIIVVLYAWHLPPFTSTVETTNNAFVKGKVTLIAPQLAGYVVEVPVTDYADVKKGDLLARIDDRIYSQQYAQSQAALATQQAALDNFAATRGAKQASLDLAKAQLDGANAMLTKAERDAGRTGSLRKSGFATEANTDQTQAQLLQAQSSVAQAEASVRMAEDNLALVDQSKSTLEAAVTGAKATLELARINLDNTRILAPVDGHLGEVAARVGQYVSPGTQMTSVTPDAVWVIANFQETQLAGMIPGQPAIVSVDALGHHKLNGRITRLSPAAGSEFSVIRPDNATGNFTKIAQRIPVRIDLEPNQPLAASLLPGMSVEAIVDTAVAPVR